MVDATAFLLPGVVGGSLFLDLFLLVALAVILKELKLIDGVWSRELSGVDY